MYRIAKKLDFCYGHRLLDHPGKCGSLHGHNAVVELDLQAEALDERGMVVDFTEVKQVLREWIDRELDHRMLLNRRDPVVAPLQQLGQPVFLLDGNPTAENIARLIYDFARSKGFPVVQVRLWETPSSYATYRGEPRP